MAKHIFLCKKCNGYTMSETHCGARTVPVQPPKYSPEDKYGKYRREYKKKSLEERGLI